MKMKDVSKIELTWNEILEVILTMTPKQREQEVKVFDYTQNKFLNDLAITFEGKPRVHFTVN